jgi:hypothetical protein
MSSTPWACKALMQAEFDPWQRLVSKGKIRLD